MRYLIIGLTILIATVPLFPSKLAVLSEIQRPHSLTVDGEYFFIVDGVKVHVYSTKNFKRTATFGKRGEGPSELLPNLEIPVQLNIINGTVILNSTTKMLYFTPTGELLQEKIFPAPFTSIVPLGKNFAAVKYTVHTDGTPIHSVLLLDNNFKKIKTLLKSARRKPKTSARGVKIPKLIYLCTYGKKLFVLDQQDCSSIKIFDLAGNHLKPFKLNLPKIKLTDSIKAETLADFKKSRAYKIYGVDPRNLKNVFHFPEYFPSVRLFNVKNDTIFIQTNKKSKGLSDFVLIDINRKSRTHASLPIDVTDVIQIGAHSSYCFQNDNYYYLVENLENEEWELHMKPIPTGVNQGLK